MRVAARFVLVGILVFCGGAASSEPLTLEVERAAVSFDQLTSEPLVTIFLKPAAGQAFFEFTRKNVGRKVEVRIDGKSVTRPFIREPITGGVIQISGHFTADRAGEIA